MPRKKHTKDQHTMEPDTEQLQSSPESPEATLPREDRERTEDSPETNEFKPDTKIKKEELEEDTTTLLEESTTTRTGTKEPTSDTRPLPSSESVSHETTSTSSDSVNETSTHTHTQGTTGTKRTPTAQASTTQALKKASKNTRPPHNKELVSKTRVPSKRAGQGTTVKTEPRRSGRQRKAESKSDAHQTQVTDFFPIRRSTRKCKAVIENEKFEEIASKLRNCREDDLRVVEDKIKGRGVVSTRPLSKGDFICEYSGELISYEEAKRREEKYSKDTDTGCYMYYFEHKNTKYCVDATVDNGRMGRLLNHSRTQANVTTKLYEVDSRPYLCLVALKDVPAEVELLYDYGERNKDAIQSHPWLTS